MKVPFENPFTPSFGEIPAHLAGRQQIVAAITRALSAERRSPELTTVFSGARGTGKTTLLSLLAHRAEASGWIVASTTALPGMLEDIELQTRKQAAHLLEPTDRARIAGVGIPQVVDITFEGDRPVSTNWRLRMSDLLDQLQDHKAGLLITVDEVDVELDEMVQLTAVYQHFVRENRRVALFMAGLPHNISMLLNDKTVSFLRRAQFVELGRIADYEVQSALEKTIREGGRAIEVADLQNMARAAGGFAFLMQLIGYRVWDANPLTETIASKDVSDGIAAAREEMVHRIFEATYRELSPGDVRFLQAMLADEGDSQIADVTERLGCSPSLASQYRRRLIDAGIIGSRTRGVVGFDLPFFRDYLLERE